MSAPLSERMRERLNLAYPAYEPHIKVKDEELIREVAGLEAQVTEHDATVEMIRNSLLYGNNRLREAEARLTGLEERNANLIEETWNLQGRTERLEAENTRLQEQNTELTQKLDALLDKIDDLERAR